MKRCDKCGGKIYSEADLDYRANVVAALFCALIYVPLFLWLLNHFGHK